MHIRRRLTVSGALIAAAVVAMALPAAAHVTVNPSTATKGSYTKLTFRVPNERDVDTVKIAVKFDLDHPIASVSVKPKAGWTYEITKAPLPEPIKTDDGEITEGVSVITWSGGAIKAGEFEEFDVSGGPMPSDTDRLTFPTVQTYADGQDVSWIDPPAAQGQPAPDHPAPTLTLVDKGDSDDSTAHAHDSASATTVAGSTGEQAGATVAASSVTESDVDGANTKAIIAIAIGGLGVLLGIAALVFGRQRTTGSDQR